MARTFDGVDDVIKMAATGGVTAPSTAITVAVIMRVAASTGEAWAAIILKKHAGLNCTYAIQQDDATNGSFCFILGANSSQYLTASTTALTANTWYLLVGRWASGGTITLRVFNVDGSINQTVASATMSFPLSYDSSLLHFGEHENLGNWKGDIAAAAVWDRKLADDEVASLWTSLAMWHSSNPGAMWLFDQASAAQTVEDLVGSGADQTAITGTAVSANSVPGFSYGADSLKVLAQPSTGLPPPIEGPENSSTMYSGLGGRR